MCVCVCAYRDTLRESVCVVAALPKEKSSSQSPEPEGTVGRHACTPCFPSLRRAAAAPHFPSWHHPSKAASADCWCHVPPRLRSRAASVRLPAPSSCACMEHVPALHDARSMDRCHADCPRSMHEPLVLSEAWRSTEYIVSGASKFSTAYGSGASDGTAAPWYRFAAPAGLRMATWSPGAQRCGNTEAGWLRGQHPVAGSPPSMATVCFTSGNSTCPHSVEIEICTCTFHAAGPEPVNMYRLPDPGDRSRNYCATSATFTPPPFPPSPPTPPPPSPLPPSPPPPIPPSPSPMPPPPPTPPPSPPVPASPPPAACHASCPQSLANSIALSARARTEPAVAL